MQPNHPVVLSDRVRTITKNLTSSAGMAVYRMGIHPDWITWFGTILVLVAAFFIAQGQFFTGAIILILGFPFDALDGAVARAMQRKDRFGELLDSTLDRYADGFVFGAIGYYFATQSRYDLLLVALAAMMGSFVVSYARARADGVGVPMKIGLFTRLERVVVLLVALLIPPLMVPALWLLAIGTNFTSLQRLWFARNALQQKDKEA